MKKLYQSQPGFLPLFKIDLKMRLTLLCLILPFLGMHAHNSYAQKVVTLNYNKTTVSHVLEEIESRTDYRFVYKVRDIDLDKEVKVKAHKEKVSEVLNKIFKNTDVDYDFFDDQVFLVKKDDPASFNIIQDKIKVTGTVTDSDGVPLSGVNITVEGTSKGTQTDFDGNYSIEAEKGQTLKFSYVGMPDQTVKVEDSDNIDVTMKEGSALDKVVVTALGIKQKEKTVTSAQQSLSSDEISKTKQPNFVNSLAGKIAGLDLEQSATGNGGSSKIILRGNKSINSISKPLFVIDGIPMVSYTEEQGTSSFESWDNGDGLSQINPNDIESISILKGANSAILYGSQGANGVILIETKSGEPGKLHGSVSSSTQFKTVFEKPKFQYRYGQENNEGIESWSTERGDYDKDFINNFFDTGIQLTNSLTLSGGSENSLSYLSYANTISEGVIPKDDYLKNNLTFKQTNNYFDDKLKITSRIMLANEKLQNRFSAGYYFNPLSGLYLFPRNNDFKDYKEYEVYDEDRNLMTQNWFVDTGGQQNPYWILNNNQSNIRKKRLIGNVSISYDLNDKMNFQIRGNYDYARNQFDQKIKVGTAGSLAPENGRYRMSDLTNSKVYADALFRYNNSFGDFDLEFNLGGSFERTKIGDGIETDSKYLGLKYANIFSLQNIEDEELIRNKIHSQLEKQGVFGTFRIGYKDMAFIDFSGRNDWSSSLAFTENISYFYPSIGASILLGEIFELPKSISFAKLRTSYSKVSNEVPAFFSRPLNSIDRNGIVINTKKPFEDLKPEDQYSLEIGANLSFFKDRIGLDFTYYRIDNKNQFLPLSAPSGSGFTTYYVNAGHIRNSGFEISLKATPIKNDQFKWKTNINFSNNKNKILELHPELKGRYQLSESEGYASYVTEGGHFSDIYTYKFERDNQGRILVNDKGEPQRSSEEEYIGDSAPDFILGWNNNINYRNWSLSFLIDSKIGGKVVGATEADLDAYGVSERTAVARDQGGVEINGVTSDGKAINTVDPKAYYKTVGGARGGILENYVYNATFVNLKELAIAYTFNFEKSSFFDTASISFIANNLFYFYKDAPFDPNVAFNPGNNFQAFNLYTLPPIRSYGINLSLNF